MSDITLCISTFNRLTDLRRLLSTAEMQEPKIPIIVYDDASNDGTSQMVREEYPEVRLITGEINIGLIGGRNICIREATTDFVMILDDDTYFESTHTVRQTLLDFEDPWVSAVAVPFVENGLLMQGSAGSQEVLLVRSFIGAAQCLRREAILRIGGMRESYHFYCEESDLAIRLLASGMNVRHGTADPIVHCPNADRDPLKRLQLRWRSELRFKWFNAPDLLLWPIIGAHIGALLRNYRRFGGLRTTLNLGVSSVKSVFMTRRERIGVSLPVYRTWQRLAKEPPLTKDDFDRMIDVRKIRMSQIGSSDLRV